MFLKWLIKSIYRIYSSPGLKTTKYRAKQVFLTSTVSNKMGDTDFSLVYTEFPKTIFCNFASIIALHLMRRWVYCQLNSGSSNATSLHKKFSAVITLHILEVEMLHSEHRVSTSCIPYSLMHFTYWFSKCRTHVSIRCSKYCPSQSLFLYCQCVPDHKCTITTEFTDFIFT
jgi:hypothetical protein